MKKILTILFLTANLSFLLIKSDSESNTTVDFKNVGSETAADKISGTSSTTNASSSSTSASDSNSKDSSSSKDSKEKSDKDKTKDTSKSKELSKEELEMVVQVAVDLANNK